MRTRTGLYQSLGGIGTALTITAISGFLLKQSPLFIEAMIWQLAIIIAIFMVTYYWVDERKGNIRLVALWILPLLIFTLSWRVPNNIFFIYTIIWVACIPFYLSAKACWIWLILINIAWFITRYAIWQEANPLIQTLLPTTFHIFALLSATAAKESQNANEKTQQLNRELVATQHLLSEASRDSERTRIARDLHDLLGHHLTALTINLQVAGRISEGEAKEKIDQCHALSKLLLSDVREAVNTLRHMPLVNLKELLEITIKDIPGLEVSLQIAEDFQLNDVNKGEVFLRVIQEATTNTLKHSHARNATIKVSKQQGKTLLHYTDDGGGCDDLKIGNGLSGMRERLEQLGGELKLEPKPNVTLRASLPN